MRTRFVGIHIAVSIALVCQGCATTRVALDAVKSIPTGGEGEKSSTPSDECHYSMISGGVIGGLLGGAIGLSLAGKDSRAIGAALGTALGSLAGVSLSAYLQDRCEKLQAAKAQMRDVKIEFTDIAIPKDVFVTPKGETSTDDVGVVVSASDTGMFSVDSDQLTATGLDDMSRLSQAFKGTDRRLLIVGHTDSTGSSEHNLKLSEARAITVARMFERIGVPAERIYYQGVGDTQPVDRNDSEQGRARNRRVDVVELDKEDSILAYSHLNQSNPRYLGRRFENLPFANAANRRGRSTARSVPSNQVSPTAVAQAQAKPAVPTPPQPAQQHQIAAAPPQAPAKPMTPTPAQQHQIAAAPPQAPAKPAPQRLATTAAPKGQQSAPPAPQPAANVPAAPPQPATTQIAARARGVRGVDIDLGGEHVTGSGAVALVKFTGRQKVAFGTEVLNALIPPAMASNPMDSPLLRTACVADPEGPEILVKSLKTMEPVNRQIADYMSGLYGSSWTKTLNGHLVGLVKVSVLKDGGRTDTAPELFVYKNYHAGDTVPAVHVIGGARTYVGEKGVLYRVFFDTRQGPMQCADIVFSRDNTALAAYGRLYYTRGRSMYAVNYQPDPVGIQH